MPSHAHRDVVIAALHAGKHVLCETPFALSIEDAEAMIAASRAAKRLLFVGLLMRSVAENVHLRDQVRSGGLGKLRSIALWRLGSYLRPGAPDAKPHYGDPSIELMTFDFDFLNWLIGPVRRLSAAAALTEAGAPGEITALLDYADGVTAVITASGIMPNSFTYSTGFRAVLERGAFELTTVFDSAIPKCNFTFHPADGPSRPVAIAGYDPCQRELQHCIDCIAWGEASALLNAEHALAALRLSIATQMSLQDGGTLQALSTATSRAEP